MKIRKKALKNWNKAEIKHLKSKLEKVKKSPEAIHGEHVSYWLIILTTILTSFIAAMSLASASIILELYVLLAVTIALGLSFGSIFALWIHELEELEIHHHLIYFLVVILSSTFSFITIFGTPVIHLLGNSKHELPVTVFYIIFFCIPYMMKLTEEYHERLDHPIRKN